MSAARQRKLYQPVPTEDDDGDSGDAHAQIHLGTPLKPAAPAPSVARQAAASFPSSGGTRDASQRANGGAVRSRPNAGAGTRSPSMRSVKAKEAIAHGRMGAFREKRKLLQDNKNLRFHDIYHAPDTWVNALFVAGVFVVIYLYHSKTWPFSK